MRLHISVVVPHKGVLCGHSVQVSRSFSWGGGCPVVPRWEEEYRFISEEPGAGEGQCSHHSGQESIIAVLLRTQGRSSRVNNSDITQNTRPFFTIWARLIPSSYTMYSYRHLPNMSCAMH